MGLNGPRRDRLIDWWRRRRLTPPRLKHVVFYDSVVAIPERVPRQTLAVVGGKGWAKWAVLECPCGRGHRLTITLQRQRKPHWTLSFDDGHPSLSPSVDSQTAYSCHFWLRHGHVRWVRRRR